MVWNDEKSSNEVERGQLNWILLDSNVVTTTTTVHLSTIFKLFELDRQDWAQIEAFSHVDLGVLGAQRQAGEEL